jgi:H+-transporting ATPase
VNDAPALSAAQVGIAVEGATDAAKNAADLILTEPGLSPIYGAVLESRRIFARIKAYVVYRVAASMIMALVLSIIIYVTGCAVDSLLVIILALLNDISMIPVAYDRAKATTKPQLPNATKLVMQSLFYGACLTALSLIFIFTINRSKIEEHPIDLDKCDAETRGFIWFHLVLVTEFAIFSVRSPSFFFLNAPAFALAFSVFITCVISAIIAIYGSSLSPVNMGIIVGVNFAMLFFVDALKMWFRQLIDDVPGDVIETDELIPVDVKKSETEKVLEKKQRYQVHRASVMSKEDMEHKVEIVETKGWKRWFTLMHPSNLPMYSGFIDKRKPFSTAASGSMSFDASTLNL